MFTYDAVQGSVGKAYPTANTNSTCSIVVTLGTYVDSYENVAIVIKGLRFVCTTVLVLHSQTLFFFLWGRERKGSGELSISLPLVYPQILGIELRSFRNDVNC